jgi:hypothetical protein
MKKIGYDGAEPCEELQASSSLVTHGMCASFDEVAVDFACRLFLFDYCSDARYDEPVLWLSNSVYLVPFV